eukprot:CAMPEP_0185756080 /NCGR_PEP_ID=MMETSP1174-20130828/14534_1 /TAXON_ID=35687 /ORGANISM="Dictyocha speculum, Strain CCMP1381" /LENGTH=796 /DNA_ID=CAMNT_0028434889 /DNA_START=161 /DNA_END=2552 /DNA_ORIENTATION=-
MISVAASNRHHEEINPASNNGRDHPMFAAKIMALHLQKGKDANPNKLGHNLGLRVAPSEIQPRHYNELKTELCEAGVCMSHTLRNVETVLSMLPDDAIQRGMLGTTGEHVKILSALEERLKTVVAQLRGVRSLHNPGEVHARNTPSRESREINLHDHHERISISDTSPHIVDQSSNEDEDSSDRFISNESNDQASTPLNWESAKSHPEAVHEESTHTPLTDSEQNDGPAQTNKQKNQAGGEPDNGAEEEAIVSCWTTFWPPKEIPVSEKYMKAKFREIDNTGDGIIEYEEAKQVLMKEGVDPKHFIQVMQSFDVDGDGLITWPEFRKGMKENTMWTRSAGLIERIFVTLDDPNSSGLAKSITVFVISCILVSITLLVLESMPSFRVHPHEDCKNQTLVEEGYNCFLAANGDECLDCEPKSMAFFFAVDCVIVPLLTLEYLLRVLTVHASQVSGEIMSINAGDESYTPREDSLVAKSQMPAACISLRQGILKTMSYTTEGMNLIDFFSVLPFYLRLILSAIADKSTGSGLDFLLAARILRMIRVFRVIRAGKSSEGLAMFGEVFKSSFPALKIIFFFVILSMIIFGCVIFEVEKGEWKVHEACPHGGGCYIRFNYAMFEEERSPFTSIPAAFWWVIVTQTTVGYGDLYPTSVAGKFTAFVVMLFGIINFALPITVLGANFADVYAKEEKLNDLFESEQEQIEFEKDEMMEDDDSTSIDRRMSRKDSNLSSSQGPPWRDAKLGKVSKVCGQNLLREQTFGAGNQNESTQSTIRYCAMTRCVEEKPFMKHPIFMKTPMV